MNLREAVQQNDGSLFRNLYATVIAVTKEELFEYERRSWLTIRDSSGSVDLAVRTDAGVDAQALIGAQIFIARGLVQVDHPLRFLTCFQREISIVQAAYEDDDSAAEEVAEPTELDVLREISQKLDLLLGESRNLTSAMIRMRRRER